MSRRGRGTPVVEAELGRGRRAVAAARARVVCVRVDEVRGERHAPVRHDRVRRGERPHRRAQGQRDGSGEHASAVNSGRAVRGGLHVLDVHRARRKRDLERADRRRAAT